ncbi:3,4-dihydroxyphenylacetate 2,3-dioxygenase [Cytobacillus kochii]|uniref:3,4-dihydroxyphenylacetate 2,3-dioxygenase n=1 Tax=Cytobacillus TaxID=2675230 RepID=UPI001CD58BCF|nr:3,4-dihydroxyphenylacetate 2,3-dioxygenase [Cytobacillus kochii]MCA1028054.1 3,4-dihydroxyphenylacetate 2,3-dioxygenase [Cytobacillus kochii]MDM5205779.1 3,4-dihydroxyphenylacetate 2,3-dioxygenase [Cytobacillus kochii]MDQ0185578.1 catechol 2,3-dioxygenase [Cytobacillus kochii]
MILRLGQIELFVTDLNKSKDFYVDVLGFIEVERTESSLYLRAIDEFDRYSLILTQKPKAALGSFSLRVSSPEYLRELEKQHQEMGVATQYVENSIHPGKGPVLKVAEPNGHPVEFYHAMEEMNVGNKSGGVDALPMRYSHLHRGIPPVAIDHMNLRVTNVDKALEYWQAIGFSISEYVQGDEGKFAAWTRAKTSTHDVALVQHKETSLHHIAYIVDGISSVVKTADLLADAGYRANIDYGPGRHGVTNAFFLYVRDPDGHRIEIYSGDYKRDTDLPPIGWTKEEYDTKGRLWWGPSVPDSFFETTPVNDEWMKEKVTK